MNGPGVFSPFPKPKAERPDFDQEVLDALYAPSVAKRETTRYDHAILRGLQGLRNVYMGTVDPVVVADRRRKNKLARAARRLNRGR